MKKLLTSEITNRMQAQFRINLRAAGCALYLRLASLFLVSNTQSALGCRGVRSRNGLQFGLGELGVGCCVTGTFITFSRVWC